jgi:SMC interacting uncharacterized protein involved in chromosome segregation
MYQQAVGDEIKNLVFKCLYVIFASIRDQKKMSYKDFLTIFT